MNKNLSDWNKVLHALTQLKDSSDEWLKKELRITEINRIEDRPEGGSEGDDGSMYIIFRADFADELLQLYYYIDSYGDESLQSIQFVEQTNVTKTEYKVI